MDIVVTTFESVAVLLGIGLIGFYIIKKGVLPARIISVLSPLALEVALPSLIFARIITTFSPEKYPDWWQLPVWWLVFTFFTACLTFVFMHFSNKAFREEFSISLFFQNAIFFPLAIITGMFPNEPSYIVYLIFFTILYPPLFFSTFQLFFRRPGSLKINYRKIFHPVLFATIIALIISYFPNYEVPMFIVTIFTALGAMTIPLIMIILGGNIYLDFRDAGSLNWLEMFKFVIVKNFIFPLFFLIFLFYFRSIIPFYIALIIVIQSAVPPLTAVPLVTERARGNRGIVNQFIVSSFIVSLFSIPLMIYFFSLIYDF